MRWGLDEVQPVFVLHGLVQIAVLEQRVVLFNAFIVLVFGFYFGDFSCARGEGMSLSLITHSCLPTPKKFDMPPYIFPITALKSTCSRGSVLIYCDGVF